MISKTSIFALVLLAMALSASAHTCQNTTGACMTNGKYMCADSTTISWEKRCDDVEDCVDGSDEFLCPHRIAKGDGPRNMHELMSCGPSCACNPSSSNVAAASPFYTMAMHAPVWSYNDGTNSGDLMSGTPLNGMWGCNTVAGKTDSVWMVWYRKGSETCVGNPRQGGFICCGRAFKCVCATGVTGNRCETG